MSKKMIKIISIILAALMVLGAVSVLYSVFGAGGFVSSFAISDGAILFAVAAVCAVIAGLICISNRKAKTRE